MAALTTLRRPITEASELMDKNCWPLKADKADKAYRCKKTFLWYTAAFGSSADSVTKHPSFLTLPTKSPSSTCSS